jgi:hypothetical protein
MFQPHGNCLNWTPWILWLTVVGNALAALAYYCLPVTLAFLARQQPTRVWKWVFNAFAAFLFACGTARVMDIVTLWWPVYVLASSVTAFSAALSALAAALLVYLAPAVTAAVRRADSLEALLLQAKADLERRAPDPHPTGGTP